jgi:hypothetical protein
MGILMGVVNEPPVSFYELSDSDEDEEGSEDREGDGGWSGGRRRRRRRRICCVGSEECYGEEREGTYSARLARAAGRVRSLTPSENIFHSKESSSGNSFIILGGGSQ